MPLHPKMSLLFIVVPIGVMIPLCCAGWLAFGERATHVPGSCLVASPISPWPTVYLNLGSWVMDTSGHIKPATLPMYEHQWPK